MIGFRRFSLLWCLFFLICVGLGYPTLNRYDPGQRNPDAVQYHKMTVDGLATGGQHFAHRLLVPSMAHLIYLATNGRTGTWDPGYFALLIINSLFVSGTSTVLFRVNGILFPNQAAVGMLATTLYLLNFVVPNLFLAGLVDSGEAFFLMVLVFAFLAERWWLIPIAVFAGTLAKETAAAFGVLFSLVWLLHRRPMSRAFLLWIMFATLGAGVIAISLAFQVTSTSLSTFAADNDAVEPKLLVAFRALTHRSLWYPFGYLVPLALMSARAMPREWKTAVLWTSLLGFALDVYRNSSADAGPDLVRPLFSIAGPLLTLSAAITITRIFQLSAARTEVCSRE